jgi:hypothetical protein
MAFLFRMRVVQAHKCNIAPRKAFDPARSMPLQRLGANPLGKIPAPGNSPENLLSFVTFPQDPIRKQ